MLDFTAALAGLPSAPADLEAFARAAINRQSSQTRRLARRHAVLDDVERHRLRIRIKKLRYTLEFFATLLPRRRLKPYLAALTPSYRTNSASPTTTSLPWNSSHRLPARHRSGPVLGWLRGRHALLLTEQAEALETWLAQAEELEKEVATMDLLLWRHAHAEEGPIDLGRASQRKGQGAGSRRGAIGLSHRTCGDGSPGEPPGAPLRANGGGFGHSVPNRSAPASGASPAAVLEACAWPE